MLKDSLPFINGKFQTKEPLLVYNSAFGVFIYQYLYQDAKDLGFEKVLTEDECVERYDEILDFMNDLCRGCSFEWCDGDFWLLPEGFEFE